MKNLAAILLMFLTVTYVSGQELKKCDSTKYYWIIPSEDISYTVKIIGEVSVTKQHNVLYVNNNALQYLIVDKKKYITDGTNPTELEILANYVSSEINYMSGQYQAKLEAQMQKAPLTGDKDAIVWWYKMPKGFNSEVTNQLFASIIIDDKIFGVASPQFSNMKFKDVQDFLMDIISTLKKVTKKKKLKNICN